MHYSRIILRKSSFRVWQEIRKPFFHSLSFLWESVFYNEGRVSISERFVWYLFSSKYWKLTPGSIPDRPKHVTNMSTFVSWILLKMNFDWPQSSPKLPWNLPPITNKCQKHLTSGQTKSNVGHPLLTKNLKRSPCGFRGCLRRVSLQNTDSVF